MPLLEEAMKANNVAMPDMAAQPQMPLPQSSGLLETLRPQESAPRPGPNPRNQALKEVFSDVMYTLAQTLAAGASAPGQRGTQLGLAAAIAGPMQRRSMIAQQEVERQKAALAQQKLEADLENSKLDAEKTRKEIEQFGIKEITRADGSKFMMKMDPVTYEPTNLGELSGPDQSQVDARTSQNAERISQNDKRAIDAATGSIAPPVALPGEVYLPMPGSQPGAPLTQAPTRMGMEQGTIPVQTSQGQRLVPSAQGQEQAAVQKKRFETDEAIRLENAQRFAPPRPFFSDPNSLLNQQRALALENQTTAAPGQLVFKSSGNPVPVTALSDARVARLEGLDTAIKQADVVEKALLSLGDTGAIKGYVEENGVYWPVVQDQLSPEQAEAVSETNRLLAAYAQAVSGLAVSDQEIGRLKKSAPSVRMTPEANQKIVGHFRRNANNKLNTYLSLLGWKINGAPVEGGGASSTVPSGVDPAVWNVMTPEERALWQN